MLAAVALTVGTIGALTAPAARASQQSAIRSGQASRGHQAAAQLWHPQALDAGTRLAPASGPAAAGSRWVSEPTPNPAGRPNGRLLADSCSGLQACTAVGNYTNKTGVVVALVERWNGAAWTLQAAPAPPRSTASELNGVSCTAADSCVAVGYDTDRAGDIVPLAESWNGKRWSVQPTAAPPGAVESALYSVACPSARACTAVGEDVLFSGQVFTLAERWNGTTWAIQHSPNPADAPASALFAVSCAAGICSAGGATENGSGTTATLAERWDGTTWAIQRTPHPPGAGTSELEGMSCTSAAACTGTGFSTDPTGTTTSVAEAWDGTTWVIQRTANPSGSAGSALNAVSCRSATSCTAAGGFATATGALSLAETWNGTRWALQPTPNPAQDVVSDLNGVSCAVPSRCVAAGFQEGGAGTLLPLAVDQTGTTWSVQAAPNPAGARPSELIGVSCPAQQDCTAVGLYTRTARVIAPLAETWDGSRWQVRPAAAAIDSPYGVLQGVSCTSPTACTAVGFYSIEGESASVPLAETWNGSTWSIQRVPIPNKARQTWLYAVSCSSASACTAVGIYENHAGVPTGLIERWNGTNWSLQATAQPVNITILLAVACPAAHACLAVGYDNTGASASQPFAEAWNGTSWRAEPMPLPAHLPGGELHGISCTSPMACTAVGNHSGAHSGPMAERWNGTRWHYQVTPDPPNATTSLSDVSLFGVSCSSATSCAAEGNYNPGGQQTSFAETWDGARWRLQPISLPPGSLGSSLYGMSCTQAACTGVGSYYGAAYLPVTLAITGPSGS
jgi:hypothetical protein